MSKEKTTKTMVNVSEKGLLDLVASKLNGVPLFQDKLEKAKEYLAKAKMKTT
jgi:hypothetical protein